MPFLPGLSLAGMGPCTDYGKRQIALTFPINIHVWYETAVFILQQLDENERGKVTDAEEKNFDLGK